MAIKTTINILKSLDRRLNIACETTGVTKNYLIMRLLKKIIKAHKKKNGKELIIAAKAVKYQKRQADTTNWMKLHIRFLAADYEYALDLKKFNKMSVSLLLAEAIKKHLAKLIRSILNDTRKNYYYPYEYFIEQDCIEGIFCWKMYWGIPPSRVPRQ